MSRNIRYVMGVVVAGFIAGAIYTMPSNSTAKSDAPEVDTFALMVSAKDLPSERFDAI